MYYFLVVHIHSMYSGMISQCYVAWASCCIFVEEAALQLGMVRVELVWARFLKTLLGSQGNSWETLHSVELGLRLAAAAAAQKQIHVPAEGSREDGVEERVAQWVDGIKKDEEDFWLRDRDQRHAQSSRNGEKRDGRHAQEIREDEHCHPLGDPGISVPRRHIRVAYAEVNAQVADAYD